MDPAFWGKHTWIYLHTLTFNYPLNPTIEDKQKYYTHFKNLGDMLPCASCSESYKIYFQYIPITEFLDDIYGITFWLYTIHYLVNKKLKKKNISFFQVVKMYYSQKSSCPKVDTTNLNNSGKCTARPPQVLDINITYSEFKNNAETKYLEKIADHISQLVKVYPSLK
jgi:hypothetical protein